MAYDETMKTLAEMRSRYASGFSPADRIYLRELYAKLLGSEMKHTGCSDCYRDAYILLYNKLKNSGTMPKEKKYILRNGVLLTFHGKHYTNINLTDDVAKAALGDNNGRKDLFSKLPDNWADEVASYIERHKTAEDDMSVEELKSVIRGLKGSVSVLEEELKEANNRIAELEAPNVEAPEADAPAEVAAAVEEAAVEEELEIAEAPAKKVKKTKK